MFINVYDYLIQELIDLTGLNCITLHQNVSDLEAKLSNSTSNINHKTALHNNWRFNMNRNVEAEQLVNTMHSAE